MRLIAHDRCNSDTVCLKLTDTKVSFNSCKFKLTQTQNVILDWPEYFLGLNCYKSEFYWIKQVFCTHSSENLFS